MLVVKCADTVTGCTNITSAKACASDMLIVVVLFSVPASDKFICTVTFLMYSFIILYDDACTERLERNAALLAVKFSIFTVLSCNE
ncbi:MAG: hypothetical protein AMDU4_FER2C00333G0001 [Ferroplasma sp. Type II]|nr:MAG: hypothetical protein AMDU4_FER2C00333G0001 [Ferroplasma sp. Type II]